MGALKAHAQFTQTLSGALGANVVNALPAQGDSRVDIARDVIDEHHFGRLDIRQMSTHLVEAGVIDRGIGLDQLQFARHHDVAKKLKEGDVGGYFLVQFT